MTFIEILSRQDSWLSNTLALGSYLGRQVFIFQFRSLPNLGRYLVTQVDRQIGRQVPNLESIMRSCSKIQPTSRPLFFFFKQLAEYHTTPHHTTTPLSSPYFLHILALYTYIPTYLNTYIPTYLPTYIPTYIPTYPHTHIPTYL